MNMDYVPLMFGTLVTSGSLLALQSDFYKKNSEGRKKIHDKNYRLYRTSANSSVINKAVLPKKMIKEILNLKKLAENDVDAELKDVFDKFVKYVDPINLECCLKNIRTVKIKKNFGFITWLKTKFDGTVGSYNPYANSLSLYDKKKASLCHEFLHMASTSRNEPYCCGFSVYKADYAEGKNVLFGEGLNEGYTELLNSRIFGSKITGDYSRNVKIARLMECFFDSYREMECAYFHNDIDAVYRAFCKYGTNKEYFALMNNLDYFADSYMFSDSIASIKLQLKLYEIIKRSGDDEKIKKFERVLGYNLGIGFNVMKKLDNYSKRIK